MRKPSPADVAIDFGPYRPSPVTLWRPFDPPPEPRYEVPAEVHEALRAIERADQDLQRHEADEATARRILRDALTRNAYGTASIEGNPLTLQEVESLLAAQPTPDRAVVPDEREILNFADLIAHLEATPVPRTPAEVADLHRALFAGVLAQPGRFKVRPNFIARRETREVLYVASPPERVEEELAAALDWLHGAARGPAEHPLVRTMVFFHEFQSIHPFDDGNGRLGRALTTLALWHQGYRGVRYALVDWAFNQDREAYYAKLDEARRPGPATGMAEGTWDRTPWLAYMAGVLEEAWRVAVRRFLFQEALPGGLHDRQVRLAEWFARMDRGNRGRRVKFNDAHAAFPTAARRTLQADLARLVEAGVIAREGERKGTTYRFAARRGAETPGR